MLQASSVSLDTFFFLPLQFFLNTSWELVIWFVSNLKVKLALCKRTISACELYKVQNNDPVSLLRLLNQLEMLYIFCSLEYFIHLQKKKNLWCSPGSRVPHYTLNIGNVFIYDGKCCFCNYIFYLFFFFSRFVPLMADPVRFSYMQPKPKQNMTVLSMLF